MALALAMALDNKGEKMKTCKQLESIIETNAAILKQHGHTATQYKLNKVLRNKQIRLENEHKRAK